MQGTGAVVAAGIVNGLRLQRTDPAEARILLFGAGSSAVGVGKAIVAYLVHEAGVDPDRAHSAIYLVDSKGLVTTTRGDELPEHKKVFARVESEKLGDIKGLKEIVARVKPHALVGLSAAGPSWGKDVVQEMCRHLERPLIFPLSNPTDKAEITAEEAYDWSEGKAVFAAGSPFDPVEMHGQKFVPGQANNVFIFPGEAARACGCGTAVPCQVVLWEGRVMDLKAVYFIPINAR